MKQEWLQTDFLLEPCPINGYKITQIPSRIKNRINTNTNIYSSKNEEPKLFSYEKSFNNNGFYLSSSGRLKPTVTIKNAKNNNINDFCIQNGYNYMNESILTNCDNSRDNYCNNGDNGGKIIDKRIIKIFNNDKPLIIMKEPDEDKENIYKYNKNRYYLTPNYYNNENDNSNFENNKYYLKRNMNCPIIDKFKNNVNSNHSRINTNIFFDSKRKIKKIYKNKTYSEPIYKDIKKSKVNGNKNNIKINPINTGKMSINQVKNFSLITKEFNQKRERKEKNNINEINNILTVTTTNLNNHKFFISNKVNKCNYENINKYLKNEKCLNNKYFYKEKNNTYNDIINKNHYSLKLERNNLVYDNINHNENEKMNNTEIKENQNDLNESEIPKRKKGKIEHYIKKYYDKQGNYIGEKNIIIKKTYKKIGKKIIKEIIKEETKSDYKNLLKKYNQKIEKEKDAQENQIKYIPYEFNNKANNNVYNNIEIQKNEENNRFTFDNKSNILKFELEDKEEKEADEQKILVNSEFEEEEENDKKEENNRKLYNKEFEQKNKENLLIDENRNDKSENNENNKNINDMEEIEKNNNKSNNENINNNLNDEHLVESKK